VKRSEWRTRRISCYVAIFAKQKSECHGLYKALWELACKTVC